MKALTLSLIVAMFAVSANASVSGETVRNCGGLNASKITETNYDSRLPDVKTTPQLARPAKSTASADSVQKPR